RRESTDMEDLFIAHIGGMDALAKGLEVAHALLNDSPWEQWRKQRYASFDSGDGKAFEEGKLGLADLASLAAKIGEPKQTSGKQERYENLLNQYLLRRWRSQRRGAWCAPATAPCPPAVRRRAHGFSREGPPMAVV